jgi:hypothetical protein
MASTQKPQLWAIRQIVVRISMSTWFCLATIAKSSNVVAFVHFDHELRGYAQDDAVMTCQPTMFSVIRKATADMIGSRA